MWNWKTKSSHCMNNHHMCAIYGGDERVLEFFQFNVPTRIIGGSPGFLGQAGPELSLLGKKRAGVVMDKVIEQLRLLEQLQPSLDEAGMEVVAVYSDVPQDSDVETVGAVRDMFVKANCDVIIAIGGGSVMDTAKAANIVIIHAGDLRDLQGAQNLERPLLPLVAIPTTVGTGSEVTMAAVIADRLDQRKLTFIDRHLAPTLAVLDPQVTFSLPTTVVAATAMDALTHAIEAYIDIEHTPFSDAMAIAAGGMVRQHLPRAVGTKGHEEARANLQIASTMAGIAFNHSMVGVVHALAHALGGVAGVPHGVANAIILPEGLRSNLDVASHRIAAFGVQTGFVSPGTSDEATAKEFIAEVEAFHRQVCELSGMPGNLRAAGVTVDQIPTLTSRASEDGSLVYNPKYIDEEEISAVYARLLKE
jgi:alcohol dehydrogenase